MTVCHCEFDSVELEDGTERGWGAWSMGGLLQYWNLSERHQFFGLQSPSQGCSVGSGISSSDRSISNCIYCGYWIFNNQVSQKEKRSWGVSDLLTSCPSLALVIDLTNTYRLYYFLLPAIMLSSQVLLSEGVGEQRSETCENSHRRESGAKWGGGAAVLQVASEHII